VILELNDKKKNLGIQKDTTPKKEFAWKSITGSTVVYTKAENEPPKGKGWIRAKDLDRG
jgi:hypothetical protein